MIRKFVKFLMFALGVYLIYFGWITGSYFYGAMGAFSVVMIAFGSGDKGKDKRK